MTGVASRKALVIAGAFFVLLVPLSVTPIQSYDYFWHLASGHWILDHGSLPPTDPFTLSSDQIPWIDGEWLFQIGAALLDRTMGETGASAARAVCVALIFSIGLGVMLHRGESTSALFVMAVAIWGADHRLTTRPETVATLLLVVGLWLLLEGNLGRWRIGAYVALTVVWMAIHPSALLAPGLAGLVLAGRFVSGERGRSLGATLVACLTSGVALLVNPWMLEGVLAPLRLASLVGSGSFVNMEWTVTSPADFPLVYLTVLSGIALFIARGRWKAEAPRLLVFAFLSALAIRYVRNHGFFFAAVPLLVAPLLPANLKPGMRRVLSVSSAILLCGLVVNHGGLRGGADADQFPVASVAHLREAGLDGNIYNPDQLGGYLIAQFYPERRVLTDGRNELHISYIEEYAKARLDQRAWNALIDKYGLVLAVDEYHRESIDVVDAVSGERRALPASLIYFPRERWALIGFDDVGMVFARRDAFPPAVIERLEFRTLVPDGAIPLVDVSPRTLEMAREEIARARALFGRQDSIDRIEKLLGVR